MHFKIYTSWADFSVHVYLPSQNPPPKSKRFLALLLRQKRAYAPNTQEDEDLAEIRAHKMNASWTLMWTTWKTPPSLLAYAPRRGSCNLCCRVLTTTESTKL